jgi:hypothetical protein
MEKSNDPKNPPPRAQATTESSKPEPHTAGSHKVAGPPPEPEVDSLNQLREILFGAIYRDLERRLTRADAHLTSKALDLEQESRRRSEVVEAHLRKDTEALTARLEHELTERSDTMRAITREHRESANSLDQRLAKVEESLTRAERGLRNELLDQAKTFLDEIQRLRHEFTETIERELGLAERAFGEETGVGAGE